MTPTEVLAHQVEGDGEPVLILNGGLMTYAAWGPVSARLVKSHRLILNDLRGQLLSPGRAPAAMAENAEDLTALLDHLEIDSVHVLGTSYGGEVGLFFAALRPERVRSLIAVTVMDYATKSIWQGVEDLRLLVADALAGGDKGRLHDRVVEEVYSRQFQAKYTDELAQRREQVAALPDVWFEGLEGIMAAMETLDARPHLESIRCPTLVVIAAKDQVIPPERSIALAAAIRGAETRTHETSGHALVAEDPQWLTEVCLEFLRRHKTQ
ncbi:MAG: alpha/beta hydrolase [Acidobacteriota bacterium]|nr:alpha/beta hydrolase [Acidobacteriota bacterium]